jgi:hypothetical protein
MEHMHPIVRKEIPDEIAINISSKQDQDSINFERYIRTNIDIDIDKIRKFQDGH